MAGHKTTRMLCGRLSDIRTEETTIDFFIADGDRTGMGVTGVAAAAAGLSGLAAGMVNMSLDETKEPVDKVSFKVDGLAVDGVFWAFPFVEGDEIEVVVEPSGDGYRAFAVARPSDRIVAMYPYAWAGSFAHYRRSFFVWFCVSFVVALFSMSISSLLFFLSDIEDWSGFFTAVSWGIVAVCIVFAVIAFNISRRLIFFSKIADGVFSAFGWRKPKHVNLRQQTKRSLRPSDPPGLGEQFFRY